MPEQASASVTSLVDFNVNFLAMELDLLHVREDVQKAMQFMWDHFISDPQNSPWNITTINDRRDAAQALALNIYPATDIASRYIMSFSDLGEEERDAVIAAAICGAYLPEAVASVKDEPDSWAVKAAEIWDISLGMEDGTVKTIEDAGQAALLLYLVHKCREFEDLIISVRTDHEEAASEEIGQIVLSKYKPIKPQFLTIDCPITNEAERLQASVEKFLPQAEIFEFGK